MTLSDLLLTLREHRACERRLFGRRQAPAMPERRTHECRTIERRSGMDRRGPAPSPARA